MTLYRRDEPLPGGVGVDDGWVVAAGVGRLAPAGGGSATTGPAGGSCRSTSIPLPGEHSVCNVLAAVAVGLLLRHRARRHPAGRWRSSPASSTASSWSPRLDGVRYVNDSQGTQPDAVIAALRSFAPPIVLIAGGRAKGVAIDELARVVAERAAAAVLIGESGAGLPGRVRARRRWRSVEWRPTLEAAVGARPTPLAPRARSRGARRAGDRPAQPGGRELRHVHRLRGARAAPSRPPWRPSSIEGAAHEEPADRASRRRARRRPAAEAPKPRVAGRARRPRGRKLTRRRSSASATRPDQTLLVSVVALAAIGILMVYSASGIRAYVTRDDGFAAVGPQLIWALLGVRRDGRRDAHRLPLLAPRLGARSSSSPSRCSCSCCVPGIGIVIGGVGALAQASGRLPAIHPAEFAKLALVVYLAHWLADARHRGSAASSAGTLPVPAHRRAGHRARARSPTWARPAS